MDIVKLDGYDDPPYAPSALAIVGTSCNHPYCTYAKKLEGLDLQADEAQRLMRNSSQRPVLNDLRRRQVDVRRHSSEMLVYNIIHYLVVYFANFKCL